MNKNSSEKLKEDGEYFLNENKNTKFNPFLNRNINIHRDFKINEVGEEFRRSINEESISLNFQKYNKSKLK